MDILVVEDDPLIATAVRDGLEAEGYTVTHTADGVSAVELGGTGRFAAIVLDVMLPSLNGFAVCTRLRARGVDTPVLMLTAKDEELDEAHGLDTGADDYLTKPFSLVVLTAHLRALIRRSTRTVAGSDEQDVLRAGDLWLDVQGRTCGRGDERIEVTGQEFAVLEVLMREPGRVLSKETILGEAWDIAYRGGTSIVEVYISLLRRKIDQPYGTRSIVTVRGHGYRLDASHA
ncbi:response regulator [Streptomyces sp. NRRL B-1677]|uniref:DNA-binding response regulator n=1 Tax=Streptomyces klenkii TaxID=1420899 RepID=A0A3B0B1N6_9ACTN|nr:MULTISPECIES: response regulator transcription factor [Streptomyces]MBF6047003.1 response regulator [Streptomyces sp. NRRL B-1677]RKN66008.1 DNA-binding response regulator [Streptomyces klenkii]